MAKQEPSANKVPDVNRTKTQPQSPGQGGHMTEANPNPHNEQNIAQMPVQTDQKGSTASQNIGASPSTREGRLHTSVGESVGGGVADTDSMFNDADPQTREIGPSGTTARKHDKAEERHPRRKSA